MSPERPGRLLLAGVLALALLGAALGCSSGLAGAAAGGAGVHHYEYVFPDGSMHVYDMDARQRLVERV
jgi:hypothetical protein